MLIGNNLQAGINKHFSAGYIPCVLDRPATMNNEGSKLVVIVLNPTTHRWEGLPWKSHPSGPQWSRSFVETDTPTDEVDTGGTLTIKKPITIRFCNFKSGEADVKFSVLPRRIKQLREPLWKSL